MRYLYLYEEETNEGSFYSVGIKDKKESAKIIRAYEIPIVFLDEKDKGDLELIINECNVSLRTIETKGEEGDKNACIIAGAILDAWGFNIKKNN